MPPSGGRQADWMGIPCTKETSNRCSADLIMGIPSLELDAVRWFCPKTCGLCTEMAQMETVGGDPIFHYGNERYKFVLPNTGQAVPLLSWTCPKGNQFRLLGATFDNGESASQWFGRFELWRGNEQILEVKRAMKEGQNPTHGLQTMRVQFSGNSSMTRKSDTVWSKDGVDLSVHKLANRVIGSEDAEDLTVSIAGLKLNIISAAAKKYGKKSVGRVRYAHLNLKVEEMPPHAQGLLAELSGKLPLSAETKSYIVPTKWGGKDGLHAKWNDTAQVLYAEEVESVAVAPQGNPPGEFGSGATVSNGTTTPTHSINPYLNGTVQSYPDRCPAQPKPLAKDKEGCKLCVSTFGKQHTFYLGADERCADGCCPNEYPCSGERAAGRACPQTAYDDVHECNSIIFPPDVVNLSKSAEGCETCLGKYGLEKTFYLGADDRCAHGCCPNDYPCSGERAAGGTCPGTAFGKVEECGSLFQGADDPCTPLCPAGTCDTPADASKPECAACSNCHDLNDKCTSFCPEGTCDGPLDASKPECEACAACHDLTSPKSHSTALRQKGEEACEGRGYDATQCRAVGCCKFAECPIGDGSGECVSNVGDGECIDTPFESHLEQLDTCESCVQACWDCTDTHTAGNDCVEGDDSYWDCMKALPCLKDATWNRHDQLEGADHFDCDVACAGKPLVDDA
eukprot:Transcript_26381.p1 GENE.Transcript_26381~~Transcript_26381.p1  ORF type:complete len:681 (-),score=143.52 Transcript_26381:1024-3066(-)